LTGTGIYYAASQFNLREFSGNSERFLIDGNQGIKDIESSEKGRYLNQLIDPLSTGRYQLNLRNNEKHQFEIVTPELSKNEENNLINQIIRRGNLQLLNEDGDDFFASKKQKKDDKTEQNNTVKRSQRLKVRDLFSHASLATVPNTYDSVIELTLKSVTTTTSEKSDYLQELKDFGTEIYAISDFGQALASARRSKLGMQILFNIIKNKSATEKKKLISILDLADGAGNYYEKHDREDPDFNNLEKDPYSYH
jgi:hypothetical protein